MNHCLIATTLLLCLLTPVLNHADEEGGAKRWFKGNTHAHTLWSDGNDFPEMVANWYKREGYDFLAISDHNILMRGEKWMKLSAVKRRQRTIGRTAMEKYVKQFGEEWVEVRGEGAGREVRLKRLEEFRPLLEGDGKFLLIEAEEITDRFQKQEVHINAVNLVDLIKPAHGASARETMRNNLIAVAEQARKEGKPIIAHLNHPNFRWSLTAEDLAHVVEDKFFEVYNGHPSINHLGSKDRPGDQKIWDIANTIRLAQLNAAPLMGVATDDSHTYHGAEVSPGRGWVMVYADKLDADTLVRAIDRGDFYASSGVTLKAVGFDEKKREVSVEVEPDGDAEYTIQFIGTKAIGGGGLPDKKDMGIVLSEVKGGSASYKVKGDDLYVRVSITSSKAHPNPSYKGQLLQAWTQPVGWKLRD